MPVAGSTRDDEGRLTGSARVSRPEARAKPKARPSVTGNVEKDIQMGPYRWVVPNLPPRTRAVPKRSRKRP